MWSGIAWLFFIERVFPILTNMFLLWARWQFLAPLLAMALFGDTRPTLPAKPLSRLPRRGRQRYYSLQAHNMQVIRLCLRCHAGCFLNGLPQKLQFENIDTLNQPFSYLYGKIIEEGEKPPLIWKTKTSFSILDTRVSVNRWWKIMKFPCSFNRYPPRCVFARESTSIYFNFIENLPVQPKQMQKTATIYLRFVSLPNVTKNEIFPDTHVLDLGSTIKHRKNCECCPVSLLTVR